MSTWARPKTRLSIMLGLYLSKSTTNGNKMAHETGISRTTIYRIVSGGIPDGDNLLKLWVWLLEEDPDNTQELNGGDRDAGQHGNMAA
jgi:hypothetical protein